MNGRIYDPGLGRFLQADPLIQDLSNPQSLNRYTYVFNNPLAYTDPTGYSAFSKYLRPILAIGAAYFTAGWSTSLYAAGNTAAALAVSVGGGALVGAIATGSGKGALIGAFTGAAAFGVGSSIAGGGSGGISNAMAKAGAQALAGGLQGQVNNGSFGAGFMVSLSVEFAQTGSLAAKSRRGTGSEGEFVEDAELTERGVAALTRYRKKEAFRDLESAARERYPNFIYKFGLGGISEFDPKNGGVLRVDFNDLDIHNPAYIQIMDMSAFVKVLPSHPDFTRRQVLFENLTVKLSLPEIFVHELHHAIYTDFGNLSGDHRIIIPKTNDFLKKHFNAKYPRHPDS